ncbi:MAG: VWA domain-containing protein [Saprospiraceae bacterium]|nr:VWA domain-containing protein [Saprospiraceae bacterium]
MKAKLCIFILVLGMGLISAACSKDGEDMPDIIRTDGLTFIIQNQFVSLPAKVSVFFKVERTADGTPVAGMTDKDFTIYETNKSNNSTKLISTDEAARQISPRAQQFGYSTLLVLDLSASVTNNNLPNLKSASKQFINSVIPANNDGSVQIGISWFDGENKLHELQGFTGNRTTLLAAIDGINANISKDNSTDLYGAVIKGVDYINNVFRTYQNDDRAYAASIVIFTDGTDQAARFTLEQSLTAVNSADKKNHFLFYWLGQ